jgi:hypothetical protein
VALFFKGALALSIQAAALAVGAMRANLLGGVARQLEAAGAYGVDIVKGVVARLV